MSEKPKKETEEIKPIFVGFITRLVGLRGPREDEGTLVVADFELHDPVGLSRGIINIPYNVDVMGNLGTPFKCTIKLEKIKMKEYVATRTGASLIKSDTKPLGCV